MFLLRGLVHGVGGVVSSVSCSDTSQHRQFEDTHGILSSDDSRVHDDAFGNLK